MEIAEAFRLSPSRSDKDLASVTAQPRPPPASPVKVSHPTPKGPRRAWLPLLGLGFLLFPLETLSFLFLPTSISAFPAWLVWQMGYRIVKVWGPHGLGVITWPTQAASTVCPLSLPRCPDPLPWGCRAVP